MVRAVGDRIVSAPPLTISDEEIDTLVSRLEQRLIRLPSITELTSIVMTAPTITVFWCSP